MAEKESRERLFTMKMSEWEYYILGKLCEKEHITFMAEYIRILLKRRYEELMQNENRE